MIYFRFAIMSFRTLTLSCLHWKIQVNFEFHTTFHSSYSFSKDRRDSGDDHRSSPASSSTSNVAIAAAAAAASQAHTVWAEEKSRLTRAASKDISHCSFVLNLRGIQI